MSARALELADDPTLSPTARMLAGILEHIQVGLAESGCPLTTEQAAVFADLGSQMRTWTA